MALASKWLPKKPKNGVTTSRENPQLKVLGSSFCEFKRRHTAQLVQSCLVRLEFVWTYTVWWPTGLLHCLTVSNSAKGWLKGWRDVYRRSCLDPSPWILKIFPNPVFFLVATLLLPNSKYPRFSHPAAWPAKIWTSLGFCQESCWVTSHKPSKARLAQTGENSGALPESFGGTLSWQWAGKCRKMWSNC